MNTEEIVFAVRRGGFWIHPQVGAMFGRKRVDWTFETSVDRV